MEKQSDRVPLYKSKTVVVNGNQYHQIMAANDGKQ